jgi:hypothetical protein
MRRIGTALQPLEASVAIPADPETQSCDNALAVLLGVVILLGMNVIGTVTEGSRERMVPPAEEASVGAAPLVASQSLEEGKRLVTAEKAALEHLGTTRPDSFGAGAPGIASAVKQSSDFGSHDLIFVLAAKSLIASGKCTAKDFDEQGGWRKAEIRSIPVYYIYCGGAAAPNRIDLNVETGEIFQ